MPQNRPAPKHAADAMLLIAIIGLTLFGLMMITSSSSVIAERFRADRFFYLKHQLAYVGTLGIAALCLGFFTPYYYWRRLALPSLVVSLILLIMVFIPGFSFHYGGASRWIHFGPVSLQPTEIAKLSFILYLAALFERKRENIRDFKHSVLPFIVISAIISILIALQPDIGTLLSIIAIAAVMVFVAGFRLTHLAMMGLAGLAIIVLLFTTEGYRLARISVYLHPELDPKGIGYQVNQALLAIGSGSWWGLGFGRSRQKYEYLPEPSGDSIFAIIAEELGFFRTLLLIAAFAFVGYRGLVIARKIQDPFGQLLATGITAWIMVQAFINMSSILALTPLTGIPLPFISYGGTAVVTMLFASGILLNISKYTVEN